MARKTKADKAIDQQVEAAYNKHFNRVPVNMMDLSKIMKIGREALQNGGVEELDRDMAAAVAKYRTD